MDDKNKTIEKKRENIEVFRIEIDKKRETIKLFWDLEIWKRIEEIYIKNGYKKSKIKIGDEEYEYYSFDPQQQRSVLLRLTIGNVLYCFRDNINLPLAFYDHGILYINLALLRIIPNERGIVKIKTDAANLFNNAVVVILAKIVKRLIESLNLEKKTRKLRAKLFIEFEKI